MDSDDAPRAARPFNRISSHRLGTERDIYMTDTSAMATVVLVHGAFADASGWAGVIRELQAADRIVVAPPNPQRGLVADAEALKPLVAAIAGPVVLVGHSYGGAVITQASAGLDNVVGLVYLAGFGLDIGESVADVQAPFAPPLLASNARPTPYDAAGAAGGPDLYIDGKTFRETFCADLPVDLAAVMAVSQRPVAAATLGEKCTAAGWKSVPAWYLVSAEDNAINPDAERFMAQRMKATTETIKGSHVAFISHPVETAAFIMSALR
jgi:pimeloyl-ACP methyl ester carboxylesterase